MAIELCSEIPSRGIGPRISFSDDLCQHDIVPVEQLPFTSNSVGVDFDFCVRQSFDQQSYSADELFSDGKILPTEIKPKITPGKQPEDDSNPLPHKEAADINSKKESSKESKSSDDDEKQNSKSFWRFKRSASLSCGNRYGRSLCPLPLLSRSNSTGSAASSAKRAPMSKELQKHPQKHASGSSKIGQSSSSASYQKPPLKKSYGSHGNGVRVDPILNVHPASNLFGFGSIFYKSKNKKR